VFFAVARAARPFGIDWAFVGRLLAATAALVCTLALLEAAPVLPRAAAGVAVFAAAVLLTRAVTAADLRLGLSTLRKA
jgi:hypothetical protein